MYKRCPRCELNYIKEQESFCKICLDEMAGKVENLDIDIINLCPFCEQCEIVYGEDRCEKCLLKLEKVDIL